MITAVDTNVLLDILIPNPVLHEASLTALSAASNRGSLVVCDIVYAELLSQFSTRTECDNFLSNGEIQVERLTPDASFLAGRSWRAYRSRGGSRTRILPDFLIGAHATLQASRLLTRDRGFYSGAYPDLEVVAP
jgi:hypothetical protein